MPIKVSCSCGQKFTAKDALKGKTILCPKCHQPLTIGAAVSRSAKQPGSDMADLFEEAGLKEVKGQRCPQCRSEVEAGAVLCVSCGLNLQTGSKIAGARILKSGEQGHGEAASVLLERANQTLAEDRAEYKKALAQGAPIWVYFLALLLLIGFAAAMLMLPKHEALWHTGTGLIVLGGLVIAVYWIRVVVMAFFENMVQGLLCLIVIPYSLVYVVLRWKTAGGFFLMQIVGGLVVGAGLGCQSLSATLVPGKNQGLLPNDVRQSIVVSRQDATDSMI